MSESMRIEGLDTTARYLELRGEPLNLRIELDGNHLWFPAGTDYYKALRDARRLFWRALEQAAPGFEVRPNP